ncbi:MAG: phosphatase PAP2 family protein [Bacteroidota bacterium]
MLIFSRILALLIIFSLIRLSTKNNNKTISFLRNLYPLLFTAYFYGETGYYNNVFFNNLDNLFIQLEDSLFGFQPSLWFSFEFNNRLINELMYFSYFSYYLLVIIFPLILYFKQRSEFEKYFIIIIFSFYTYYLLFAIFPVVGPQFHFPAEQLNLTDTSFFGKIVKLIQDAGETPTGAFPSSHVGISWIIFIISLRTNKKYLKLIFALALSICISTVYIKAHYVVDVIGGIISAPLFYFLGHKIYLNYHKKQYLLIN